MLTTIVNLYYDGACRLNGKSNAKTGCGYTVNEHEGFKYLGYGTNNTAEYYGLIHALEFAEQLYGTDITIKVHGDSKLVTEQMKGTWKINAPTLKALNTRAKELSKKFKFVEFIHVLRHLNSKADELANKSFIGN
jgi:ribonuclease HI